MLGWLLLAALTLSLADALFLLVVADRIGALPTVGLVVLTALVGAMLVRSKGRTTLGRLQERLQNAELPTDELTDGAFILVGGALLLTPGLLTDVTGFLFVFPLSRYPLRVALTRWVVGPYVRRRIQDGSIDVRIGGGVGNVTWEDAGDGGQDGTDGTDGPEDHYVLDDDAYEFDADNERPP